MAVEYRVFFLTPGQKAPKGSTSVGLANGGIVWIGEEGTFPSVVVLGHQTYWDIIPEKFYNNRAMTDEEINEYHAILDSINEI